MMQPLQKRKNPYVEYAKEKISANSIKNMNQSLDKALQTATKRNKRPPTFAKGMYV